MHGKFPTLPKSLFFCSVSSLSATLSFGLWASFRLTTIFFRFIRLMRTLPRGAQGF